MRPAGLSARPSDFGRSASQDGLSDFCGDCRVRSAESLCGCQTPWLKFCKECSALHVAKSSQGFHALLPAKYLKSAKTRQDFQRFCAREEEAAEVLQWLQGALDGVTEAEKTLERFVSACTEELSAWRQEWQRQLQAVRDRMTQDIRHVRERVEAELVTCTEVDKLKILKERRPTLLDFHLPELSLHSTLNASTSVTLYSPVLAQELGSEPSGGGDASSQSSILKSVTSIIATCKDMARVAAPSNPVTELDLPRDSLAAWARQAEWVATQTAARVCQSLGEASAACDLLLGAKASAFAGCSIAQKLNTIHIAVSEGMRACRELPRSLRAKASTEELKQTVAVQFRQCAELSAHVSSLQSELSQHKDCADLRDSLSRLELRARSAEEKQAQTELQLRDNLEQYCRAIIAQHREKLSAVSQLVSTEVEGKRRKEGETMRELQEIIKQTVTGVQKSLSNDAEKGGELRSIAEKVAKGQALLSEIRTEDASTVEWKTATERLRRDAATKVAMFLSNILEEVFSMLRKIAQENDQRLMQSMEMLTQLIMSPNLTGISSWYEKCKPLIPKKKLAEYEPMMVCHRSFMDELNKVISSFASEFGSSAQELESIKKHCDSVFSPLAPGLLADQIKAVSAAGQSLFAQVASQCADTMQAALIPLKHTLTEIAQVVAAFSPKLQSLISSAASSLQTRLLQVCDCAGTGLQQGCEHMANTLKQETAQEVPDFPPAVSIVPLPIQTQTKAIEDLQTDLGRTSRELDSLRVAYYAIRLRHYSQAIEQRWSRDMCNVLSVWTARATLTPDKRKSLCEKSLPRLRLPAVFRPLPICETDSMVPEERPMSVLQAFQFFDATLGALYEESRRAVLEARKIESYASAVIKPRFSRLLSKALPILSRLYAYEQPHAVLLAKVFGLFGQSPLSPEGCFVVNHHRQAFKSLAFATGSALRTEQYLCSVCWEASLDAVLREYLLLVVHGSESLRVWAAWVAHLKPEEVTVAAFGWFLCDWLLRHFVTASWESIWRAASSAGEVTVDSLQSSLFSSTDKLIPSSIIAAMLPRALTREEFQQTVEQSVANSQAEFRVRGDMFLCGVVEAIKTMEEINRDIQANYTGADKAVGYAHPLLTSQVAFLQSGKAPLLE